MNLHDRSQVIPDGTTQAKKAEQHRRPASKRVRWHTQYAQAANTPKQPIRPRLAAKSSGDVQRAGRRSTFVRHVAMPRIERIGKMASLWQYDDLTGSAHSFGRSCDGWSRSLACAVHLHKIAACARTVPCWSRLPGAAKGRVCRT